MATKVELLSNVTVLIGDTKAKRASELADDLRDSGFATIQIALSLEEVRNKIMEGETDVVILADTLGGQIFQLTRDIRQMRFGKNPFMTILCALAPEHVDGAKLALLAGVDNILVQPVLGKHVADRVRKISKTETPFVVTSEYIGPDRRAGERTSAIRRFYVPQTTRDKVRGKKINYDEFAKTIAPVVEDMLKTRLTSLSGRLGMICKELVTAYQTSQITTVVKDKMLIVLDVLKQAATTAKQIDQDDVAALCLAQGKQVADFAERYTQPTEKDITLISKLAERIATAAKTGVAVEEESPVEEERDLSCPDLDEPAIEIQFIQKGQRLFKEGDEAVAAYVVAAGCMGIFRKVDGKNSPVARIKKGEFFGEMAILDGSTRRATAVALEDTTLSLVSKESLEEKMAASDELIRMILLTAVQNLRTAHDTYTQRARSLQDMLKTISLSRHITGRFIERLDIKPDEEEAKKLLKDFDAKFAEVVSGCAPAIAADRRDDRVMTDEELAEANK